MSLRSALGFGALAEYSKEMDLLEFSVGINPDACLVTHPRKGRMDTCSLLSAPVVTRIARCSSTGTVVIVISTIIIINFDIDYRHGFSENGG